MDFIDVTLVQVENRMRSELGDIDQLANSIKENGLIQPIVLTGSIDEGIFLVAGHRRFEAMKKLGIQTLNRGEHFIWREELMSDEYRRNAVELEENIRRKAMTWHEEALGKQRLLQIYEKIYGAPVPGQPQRSVQQGLKPSGFGVRKLAELLNESASQTSEDLKIASLITQLPALKNEASREAAQRKLGQAIAQLASSGAVRMAKPLVYKILLTCESEQHQIALLTQFRGLGLTCQAIVS